MSAPAPIQAQERLPRADEARLIALAKQGFKTDYRYLVSVLDSAHARKVR